MALGKHAQSEKGHMFPKASRRKPENGLLKMHFGMEVISGEENHFRETLAFSLSDTLAFSLSDLWVPIVAVL